MKNPRTETAFRYLCLSLCCLFFFYLGEWDGARKGKEIGFEQGKAEIEHELTMRVIDHKYALDQCRSWAIWKTKGGWKG